MINDISQLSPEVLEQLKALFRQETGDDTSNRTPLVRKTLTDLRTPRNPTSKLHRPTFFPVDEADEQVKPYRYQAFPKLKFKLDDTGKLVETCVFNAESEKALGHEWADAPPWAAPVSSAERLRAELEALSPEDREFVLEAQRKQRLARLESALSHLSDAQLADVTGGVTPTKARKK